MKDEAAIPQFTQTQMTPDDTDVHPSSSGNVSSTFQSPSSSYASSWFKTSPYEDEDGESMRTGCINKLGNKSPSFAFSVKEHVRLGAKLSEIVKGKLSLGAKVIQGGGRRRVFERVFGLNDGEEMFKASQCYLSTTTGPIAGLIFISSQKIAFCSERSITISSSSGESAKSLYKVCIPIEKIKRANRSENVDNPMQKYIEIVTDDGFEFWFMGFLRYEKAFHNLQKVLSMVK
uniref:GRAM domain-containing protein n=2 Tax=Kalanchoe fedtschenkoi TaxID=63787 RepID=A0A7N0VBE1_KALFE